MSYITKLVVEWASDTTGGCTEIYSHAIPINNYENRKQDVVYTEVMLPQGAKNDFKEREYLWNEMEAAEDSFSTRPKQAQVCRDCILALPKDERLSTKDRIELARRFAMEHFVKKGVAVDLAIHDKGDGNPHAHLLITTRRIDKDGIIMVGLFWTTK